MPELAAAHAALLELEKFDHAVDEARAAKHDAHVLAAKTGTPEHAEAHASAEAEFHAAVKARREAPHTQRDIDIAAQAVLAARKGE